MTIFENDRALLDAFRRGDRAALERVYTTYVADVLTVIRSGFVRDDYRVPGVADPDRQRDLLHEVFTRAFAERARDSYDGLRPYRPYLLQITRNLMVDTWRKRKEALAEDPATVADPPDPDVRAPEAQIDWQRRMAATRDYVATLDDVSRAVVRLRFEESRSQADVAAELRLSRRRVRTLEARIYAGLRKALKPLR